MRTLLGMLVFAFSFPTCLMAQEPISWSPGGSQVVPPRDSVPDPTAASLLKRMFTSTNSEPEIKNNSLLPVPTQTQPSTLDMPITGPNAGIQGSNIPSLPTTNPGNSAQPYQNGPTAANTLDSWMNYRQPGCCGPIGRDGPIITELYTRNGIFFPIGGGFLRNHLVEGFSTAMGGRSLFMNSAGTEAFTVDLGVTFIYNNGPSRTPFPLFNAGPVSIQKFERTSVNLTFGKDWFDDGPAFFSHNPHSVWNYGFDFGGFYGSSHTDLSVYHSAISYDRRQAVVGGPTASVHSGFQVPMGSWFLFTDVRLQWNLTYTNALPGYNLYLNELGLLWSVGIRH